MTIDPEEQRLRDRVVEAAERLASEWQRSVGRPEFSEFEINAGRNLRYAVRDLIEYRNRIAVPSCEPAPGSENGSIHWLRLGDTLETFKWKAGNHPWGWVGFGSAGDETLPTEMAKLGWIYHSPARPRGEQRALTDDDIAEIWQRSNGDWPSDITRFGRALLSRARG